MSRIDEVIVKDGDGVRSNELPYNTLNSAYKTMVSNPDNWVKKADNYYLWISRNDMSVLSMRVNTIESIEQRTLILNLSVYVGAQSDSMEMTMEDLQNIDFPFIDDVNETYNELLKEHFEDTGELPVGDDLDSAYTELLESIDQIDFGNCEYIMPYIEKIHKLGDYQWKLINSLHYDTPFLVLLSMSKTVSPRPCIKILPVVNGDDYFEGYFSAEPCEVYPNGMIKKVNLAEDINWDNLVNQIKCPQDKIEELLQLTVKRCIGDDVRDTQTQFSGLE